MILNTSSVRILSLVSFSWPREAGILPDISAEVKNNVANMLNVG
jgi:hypothetical protein